MPTKTPIKKRVASKAVSAKKTIKKTVAKKAPVKKKTGVKRLLELRKKGSVNKKGLLIGGGAIVVLALAFTGYSLWQNMGANAGGTSSLGRSGVITKAESITLSNGSVSATVTACKVATSSKYFSVHESARLTAATPSKGTIGYHPLSNLRFYAQLYNTSSGYIGSNTGMTVGSVSQVTYPSALATTKMHLASGFGSVTVHQSWTLDNDSYVAVSGIPTCAK